MKEKDPLYLNTYIYWCIVNCVVIVSGFSIQCPSFRVKYCTLASRLRVSHTVWQGARDVRCFSCRGMKSSSKKYLRQFVS
jgi:hypothetical protein